MLLALLLAAAQPGPAAADADPPVPREAHVFHDWVVACDNGGRCSAIGLQPETAAQPGNGNFMLAREPGPDAPLLGYLVGLEGTPARLATFGEALPATLAPDDEGDFRVALTDRATFLERAGYADEIEVQDAAGAVIARLSAKGMRHALLYMDEAQGRLHTPGALIRTGRRATAGTPRPVPAVRLAPSTGEAPLAIPPARIARLRRENRCVIADVGGPDEAEIVALGGGQTLILLACGTGAYNLSSVPFVATRAGGEIRIEPAPFDLPLEAYDEAAGHRILINAGWDGEEMTIDDFSKGRGLGDCGSRSRYGWDGTRFRLIHREQMPDCRGALTFLTTWRADTAR